MKPGANKRIATVDRNVGIVRIPSSSLSGVTLLMSVYTRSPPALFPMDDILSPEPAMKPLPGERPTKDQSLHQRSPTDSAVTYKPTLYTLASVRSVLLR